MLTHIDPISDSANTTKVHHQIGKKHTQVNFKFVLKLYLFLVIDPNQNT